jgi:hypothetical protein
MTMTTKKRQPSRNRRDIGEVVFPIEKMQRARELSSCCVGVEAMLQADSGVYGSESRLFVRSATPKKETD